MNTTTMTSVERIAFMSSTSDLMRAVRALNADLESAMIAGVTGTHAHLGMLEMVQAFSFELTQRGYTKGVKADGSDLPWDCSWIDDNDGCGHAKLSNSIRVF